MKTKLTPFDYVHREDRGSSRQRAHLIRDVSLFILKRLFLLIMFLLMGLHH